MRKKGIAFSNYKESMIYAIPDPVFTTDVVGKSGLGMQAGEYLEHNEIPRVVGTSHIGNLISIIKERENEKDGIGIKNHMQQDPEFEL